jgi:DNA processing protein
MLQDELKYYIAIGQVPGVGPILAKRIIAYCGGVAAVFREKKVALQKIPGVGAMLAQGIVNQQVLLQAEKECAFLEQYGLKGLCYTDAAYPERLRQCEDAPIVLFVNGTIDFNQQKILSIVGTRHATPYGLKWCESIVGQLVEHGHAPVIVSGLAYGIDICAHKAALQHNLPTVAVMATGLDKIYPSLHRPTAKKIVEQPGSALVTDFVRGTKPDRSNFVRRNRIIAGLADATLVVESGEKGGALITAEMAVSYNRDVLALPGRITDLYSKGCNALIRKNKAALVETLADIEYALGWEQSCTAVKERQLPLFVTLTEEEQKIVGILKDKPAETIDTLSRLTEMAMPRLSALLFNMEMKEIIRTLPGKQYALK